MQKVSLLQLADVVTGKHDANHATTNGRYRFYTCAFEYSMCDTYRFDDECLIVPGNGANVGEVFYYNGRFDAYQRTYVVHNIKKEKVIPKYLFFHFQYNWRTLGTAEQYGAATNYIKIGNFINYKISLAPIELQKKIVGELDLLSSVIEKKKAQLEEYDQLAQSIFYDMFGDPITNEKGWEVKKLGEVYKLKSGNGLSAKQFVNGPYPVYGGNGISGMHNAYNMDGNYIIIGRVGVYCGNVRNVLGKFWLTDNAFQLFYDNRQQSPLFVTHLLSSLNLHQYANQAAQPVISNTTLKEVNIIFPPLSLQQQFAEKIEAIERQKELIKQSIAETETLFNSRMDYYFN